MTRSEAAKRQAQRIEVRNMVARFPVHLDTSADLEHCISEILKYGEAREAEGRASVLEEW